MTAPQTTVPQATLAPAVAPRVAADESILRGRRLRDGAVLTSCFADDEWDLSPAGFAPNISPSALRINWTKIGAPALRLAMKEYLWARLNEPVGRDRPYKITTAATTAEYALIFTRYFEDIHGVTRLGAITRSEYDAFMRWLGTQAWADNRKLGIAYLGRALHRYERRLSDPLTITPARGRRLAAALGITRADKENATPRIPEAVMGPLLQWSLRYVDEFSVEIFAAFERYLGRRALRVEKPKANTPVAPRLLAYGAELKAAGRGLPSIHNRSQRWDKHTRADDPLARLNLKALCQQALSGAMSWGHLLEQHRPLLERLVAEVGYDVDQAAPPESLAALGGYGRSELSLRSEIAILQLACYCVVTYLSGMRESEVGSLRRGCVQITRDEDGRPIMYKLVGRLYKHRAEEGDAADWVVIEPVVRAVAVLDRLHELAGSDAAEQLFARVQVGRPCLRPETSANLSKRLRTYVQRINELAARSTRTPPVPDVDGEPWPLQSRQFRRTLAWYIANQPFGIVAGAIQYKHTQVSIFQGYGGSRAAGFRDEVAREEARRRVTLVREVYEERKLGVDHGAGGGAQALGAALDAVRAEVNDVPGAVEVDERRLLARLKSLAANLHVGILSDCFYREATAMCKPWQTETNKPAFARCAPGLCGNSRIEARHLPAWERALKDAETHLARRDLPTLQREVLEVDRKRYLTVITQVSGGDA